MGEFIDFIREQGLEPSVVSQITISEWGRSVAVACSHTTDGTAREYRLLFGECSHVSWEVHDESIDATEPQTDIIGFETQAQRRGVKPHRERDNVAVLETTSFELIISYTTFTLEMH
jgi:hypothetical protein